MGKTNLHHPTNTLLGPWAYSTQDNASRPFNDLPTLDIQPSEKPFSFQEIRIRYTSRIRTALNVFWDLLRHPTLIFEVIYCECRVRYMHARSKR